MGKRVRSPDRNTCVRALGGRRMACYGGPLSSIPRCNFFTLHAYAALLVASTAGFALEPWTPMGTHSRNAPTRLGGTGPSSVRGRVSAICRLGGGASDNDPCNGTGYTVGKKEGGIDMVVVGKLIVDEFEATEVSGTNFEGMPSPTRKIERLGGGSTQAAFGGCAWGRNVGLIAPVGEDFPPSMEAYLHSVGVDTLGVEQLDGFKTPRESIRCSCLPSSSCLAPPKPNQSVRWSVDLWVWKTCEVPPCQSEVPSPSTCRNSTEHRILLYPYPCNPTLILTLTLLPWPVTKACLHAAFLQ
ncbi:unnamed protein product [Discosporangium mesarthrocarpum]